MTPQINSARRVAVVAILCLGWCLLVLAASLSLASARGAIIG